MLTLFRTIRASIAISSAAASMTGCLGIHDLTPPNTNDGSTDASGPDGSAPGDATTNSDAFPAPDAGSEAATEATAEAAPFEGGDGNQGCSGLVCSGVCVPDDVHNCGTCGNDCTALSHVSGAVTCNAGKCSVPLSSCAPGWSHCAGNPDDGCDTDITKPANCGACGAVCPATTPQCSASATSFSCVSMCPGMAPPCNGACVTQSTDPNNCGGCGHTCPAVAHAQPTCGGGTCAFQCNAGYSNCGGTCIDTTTDSNNCGACNNKCAAGTTCSASQCVCTTASCGTIGCCNSATTCEPFSSQSNLSCGTGGKACGSCTAVQTCGAVTPGVCGCVPSGSCGTRTCGTVPDGCGNMIACGACGSGASCDGNGACQCNSGLTSCGSSCVNESTDPSNCGACGAKCATGQCSGGVCIGSTTSGTSCQTGGPGRTNCGTGAESCCTSSEVTGGMFYRTYTNSGGGPTGEADPATVSGFRLDKYLVTVGRFRQFVNAWKSGGGLPAMGSGKHTHLNNGQGLRDPGTGAFEPGWATTDNGNIAPTDGNLTGGTWTSSPGSQENLPITTVNWFEAYAFCIWDGGFLPSEAEWEYAQAGGSQQRQYPWGSTAPGTTNMYAIYGCYYPDGSGNCANATVAPVGTANLGVGLWGQLDLAGNMEAWVFDVYGPYATPCNDCAYVQLPSNGQRSVRSDFDIADASQLVATTRWLDYPVNRGDSMRCARTP